jgi:uncharacterized SAM-binding protein YcdF (DUF218 family)
MEGGTRGWRCPSEALSCETNPDRIPMKALLLAVLVLACVLLILRSGSFLVLDNPEKSDALVVLGGDQGDLRYWHGLELLRNGYGSHLVLDTYGSLIYGRSYSELAAGFVARTAGDQVSRVSLCTIEYDSTKQETGDVGRCLSRLRPAPHSVLLVTDDYHTRRALSIFRDRLPQYHWSTAASHNPYFFGLPWWKHREWAKTYALECQKLLYWEVFDRWRK